MARPRISKEERRQHIIANAARVFGEHGYDGARTRWIADACGMNEALIYRYFPSKEEMFIEAVKFIHEKAVGHWDMIIANAPDSLEALRQIFLSRIFRVYHNPQMAANILHGTVASGKHEGMRQLSTEWFRAAHETITGLISKGISEGVIRPGLDPDTVAFWIRSFAYFINVVQVEGLEEHLKMDKAMAILDEYFDSIATPEGISRKIRFEPDSSRPF